MFLDTDADKFAPPLRAIADQIRHCAPARYLGALTETARDGGARPEPEQGSRDARPNKDERERLALPPSRNRTESSVPRVQSSNSWHASACAHRPHLDAARDSFTMGACIDKFSIRVSLR